MRNDFLPFSKPSISEEEILAVNEVLRSGWITTGLKAAAFEEAFACYCGAREAVALASATAGMHLIFQAMGLKPGDEVVTPSMTWVSTVNLITLAGARPVFADCDRDTLMVTPETIAPCLSERTRLIVPVHFAGASLDLDPIRALAAAHHIPLVEDAAHAVGTQYQGRMIGTDGTSIFSFHPIKNITCGEGGMMVTDDGALMERIRRLKFHGLGVDAYDRASQGRAPQAEVIEPGFKYNLTDFAAVLGLGQLARLEGFIARRTLLAQLYLDLLADIPEIRPLSLPTWPMRHAWHLFIVRLDVERAGISRDEFMARLKAKNIGSGLHFRAVHSQRYYRETLALPTGALPNTEWNSERILSLPLFPAMTEGDVEQVVTTIKEVLAP
jgi:UDP-4-amino-4-deoxy-L-arabinose-oxoglutarate aminotransferase